MFKKGTKLYSIFNNKCPRCHNGDFFDQKSNFSFKKIMKMHDTCSSCKLKYTIEPSFFFGAMFVNYALTVAIGIATFTFGYLFFDLTILQSFLSIIAVLIFLIPFTLKLSRTIWINIFVGYDKKYDTKS